MRLSNIFGGHPTNVGFGAAHFAALLFAAIAAFIAYDIAADQGAGTSATHLFSESAMMALALAGVAALWRQIRMTRRQAEQLRVDLAEATEAADRFRSDARDALRGLGEAIDRQFERWKLTPAERDVAMLLLKGLSQKEIAQARATSENTIRQQSLLIYRKAGLRNRSELSAFFLEDLLLPIEQR